MGKPSVKQVIVFMVILTVFWTMAVVVTYIFAVPVLVAGAVGGVFGFLSVAAGMKAAQATNRKDK